MQQQQGCSPSWLRLAPVVKCSRPAICKRCTPTAPRLRARTPPTPTRLQPAGTHRTAVAELFAQLLRAQCPVVARGVAASGLLRRLAVFAVEQPSCSPIYGVVGRCLRLSLPLTC